MSSLWLQSVRRLKDAACHSRSAPAFDGLSAAFQLPSAAHQPAFARTSTAFRRPSSPFDRSPPAVVRLSAAFRLPLAAPSPAVQLLASQDLDPRNPPPELRHPPGRKRKAGQGRHLFICRCATPLSAWCLCVCVFVRLVVWSFGRLVVWSFGRSGLLRLNKVEKEGRQDSLTGPATAAGAGCCEPGLRRPCDLHPRQGLWAD